MPQQVPVPPAAPGIPGQVLVDGKALSSPQAVYAGLVHQQRELGNQIETLKRERSNVGTWLGPEHKIDGADRLGLQKRIISLDARLDVVEQQRAAVDAQVAKAAAVPGAIVDPPPTVRRGPPDEAFVLSAIFMFVAILPLSVAFARRVWRRGNEPRPSNPHITDERFSQLDQAVEAIALEVERIGEGQRFITRVLSEHGRVAVSNGAARPIDVPSRADAPS